MVQNNRVKAFVQIFNIRHKRLLFVISTKRITEQRIKNCRREHRYIR